MEELQRLLIIILLSESKSEKLYLEGAKLVTGKKKQKNKKQVQKKSRKGKKEKSWKKLKKS